MKRTIAIYCNTDELKIIDEAAESNKRSRTSFLMFHGLQAAKKILENEVEEKDVLQKICDGKSIRT